MLIDTIERLTTIMESTTAWDLQYREVVDVDVSKVTICAEQLMSLMASITGKLWIIVSIRVYMITNRSIQAVVQSSTSA